MKDAMTRSRSGVCPDVDWDLALLAAERAAGLDRRFRAMTALLNRLGAQLI
jgi:hypothetical protein